MTWDPRDIAFEKLTKRQQAKALWELATKRRDEATVNAAAGFTTIAESQVEQARTLEDRARALEAELKKK